MALLTRPCASISSLVDSDRDTVYSPRYVKINNLQKKVTTPLPANTGLYKCTVFEKKVKMLLKTSFSMYLHTGSYKTAKGST